MARTVSGECDQRTSLDVVLALSPNSWNAFSKMASQERLRD